MTKRGKVTSVHSHLIVGLGGEGRGGAGSAHSSSLDDIQLSLGGVDWLLVSLCQCQEFICTKQITDLP